MVNRNNNWSTAGEILNKGQRYSILNKALALYRTTLGLIPSLAYALSKQCQKLALTTAGYGRKPTKTQPTKTPNTWQKHRVRAVEEKASELYHM